MKHCTQEQYVPVASAVLSDLNRFPKESRTWLWTFGKDFTRVIRNMKELPCVIKLSAHQRETNLSLDNYPSCGYLYDQNDNSPCPFIYLKHHSEARAGYHMPSAEEKMNKPLTLPDLEVLSMVRGPKPSLLSLSAPLCLYPSLTIL